MRPPLSPSQEAAAHRGAGDACVMAGAGSGKTTVLTARVRHLVGALKADPRRVAALTFTDKAAGEMRERIADAFLSGEGGVDPALAREVEFAPISTIHAFCARLLHEHAIEAGVDPAFTLLDGTEARLLLEDAYAAVERSRLGKGDAGLSVLFLLGRADAKARVLDFLVRARGLGIALRDLSWGSGPLDATAAAARLRDAFDALDEAVVASLPSAAVLGAYRAARAALPAPPDPAAPSFEAAALAADAKARISHAKRIWLPIPEGKATSPLRDAVVEAYGSVAGAILDALASREVAGPLRDLVADVDAAYEARKRARGVLDFADLERKALDLLVRLEERGRVLEGRPENLLVDEYQDTNPVQARILARLRAGGPGARIDQFAVGDPKQSIFRFRLADVSVMRGEWRAVGPAGQASLNETFRSRPELVRFHNAVFGRLFEGNAAGVPYDPLVAAGAFHDGPPIPPEVLLVVADAESRHEAEAAAVVRRIESWVRGGALRTKRARPSDARPGTVAPPRPLRWKDVAILFRAHKTAKTYERALLAAGIPFEVTKGRGFYDTEEIADLVHLLRVVHDPRDAHAVAAWLASPAVGATDSDLLAAFSHPGGPFAAAAGVPALAGAVERVLALRRLAASSPLARLVEAALDSAASVPTALLQDGGTRRAANLEKVLSVARRLDDEGGRGSWTCCGGSRICAPARSTRPRRPPRDPATR